LLLFLFDVKKLALCLLRVDEDLVLLDDVSIEDLSNLGRELCKTHDVSKLELEVKTLHEARDFFKVEEVRDVLSHGDGGVQNIFWQRDLLLPLLDGYPVLLLNQSSDIRGLENHRVDWVRLRLVVDLYALKAENRLEQLRALLDVDKDALEI